MLCAASLAACSGPGDSIPESPSTPVPARSHWALSHRVLESADVQVTGHRISHYAESTTVGLGRDANGGAEISCSVGVSIPG